MERWKIVRKRWSFSSFLFNQQSNQDECLVLKSPTIIKNQGFPEERDCDTQKACIRMKLRESNDWLGQYTEAMKIVDDWIPKEMMVDSIDLKVLGEGNSQLRVCQKWLHRRCHGLSGWTIVGLSGRG